MRRSPKLALASALFLVFFNASLLLAQTATPTPPSSSQAAAAEGNVMIEELKSPNAGTRAKAARELGKAQDVSGLPALAEAVSDKGCPRSKRPHANPAITRGLAAK
jgi:hypothetical protein